MFEQRQLTDNRDHYSMSLILKFVQSGIADKIVVAICDSTAQDVIRVCCLQIARKNCLCSVDKF